MQIGNSLRMQIVLAQHAKIIDFFKHIISTRMFFFILRIKILFLKIFLTLPVEHVRLCSHYFVEKQQLYSCINFIDSMRSRNSPPIQGAQAVLYA